MNVELEDSTGITQNVTSLLSVTATAAQGTLPTLTTDSTYTLTATIADEYGNTSLTKNSFYVFTGTVPPVTPSEPGWVMGEVFNSETCDQYLTTCQGLAGAEVTLWQVDPESLAGSREERQDDYFNYASQLGIMPAAEEQITDTFASPITGTVVTGPDGFFAFPVAETGVYWIRVEKDGFTYSQREVAVVKERSTAVNDIYLTPFDPATTLCDETGCTHTSDDEQIIVEIPPGAIPDGEEVEVTATEFDRVFFLPGGELPPGTGETYAFNLGGNSDYEFQLPITVSIQNSRGFTIGAEIPLGFNRK